VRSAAQYIIILSHWNIPTRTLPRPRRDPRPLVRPVPTVSFPQTKKSRNKPWPTSKSVSTYMSSNDYGAPPQQEEHL